MKTTQSYRYELKLNNEQLGLLLKHCGVARFAYNWGLAERIALFNQNEGRDRFTNAIEQHRRLNALKRPQFPWMYDVSKCAPQEALRDLDKAFANFRNGCKNVRRAGFPKFKKKGGHDSFRLYGAIHIGDTFVALPRLGTMRVKESTNKLKGRVLSATISREADRWFVSFAVERERPDSLPIQGDMVGIDLGINSFATVCDGERVEYFYAPKPLVRSMERLRRLSRCHSRKQKGSSNRRKSSLKLARLHWHIKNIRTDFLHKLSTSLAKTKSAIVIEDLNVRGMVSNRHLARSIADVGWGEFRRMLEYKSKWYGSQLVVIGRFEPTSKMCSECGVINQALTLSDRQWVCMSCGVLHERDENAAKNIRHLGLEKLSTESSSGSNACGVAGRPLLAKAGDYEAGSKHMDCILGCEKCQDLWDGAGA